MSDIYNWSEIEDNSYDVIISRQFFEHLEFWITMSQIERVLNPGGYDCIIAQSNSPRHGGNMANCNLFYEDGLKALQNINLEVIHTSFDEREEATPK